VDRGALVACGEAARGFKDERDSKGCESEEGGALRRAMPKGVGVKGGALMGDSSVGFRFLARGVAGSFGMVESDSASFGTLSCGDVGDAVVLRFFGKAAGLETLEYFATPFVGLVSEADAAVLPATLADRRKDMLMGHGKSCSLLVFRCA
jgi:hypothetical protein